MYRSSLAYLRGDVEIKLKSKPHGGKKTTAEKMLERAATACIKVDRQTGKITGFEEYLE